MADFPLVPDFVFDETPQFRTLVSTMESGYEQRRSKWSSDLRRFRLSFKDRPKTDFETMRDFFIARLGKFDSFTFLNPNNNTEYTVCFADDDFKFQNTAPTKYDFSCTLAEVK